MVGGGGNGLYRVARAYRPVIAFEVGVWDNPSPCKRKLYDLGRV